MGKTAAASHHFGRESQRTRDHGEREASAEDTSSVHAIEAYWAKPLRKGDLLIATALVHSHVARARPSCSCMAAPHANRLAHKNRGKHGRTRHSRPHDGRRVGIARGRDRAHHSIHDQRGLLHPTCKGEQNLRLYRRPTRNASTESSPLKYLGFSLSQIQEGEGSDSLAN